MAGTMRKAALSVVFTFHATRAVSLFVILRTSATALEKTPLNVSFSPAGSSPSLKFPLAILSSLFPFLSLRSRSADRSRSAKNKKNESQLC